MKAIGYVRVSTAGQAEDGISLEAQEARIRAWAVSKGIETVEIHVDAGLSGKRTENRPALIKALAATRKGDVLVTYSLSRLSRSTRDAIDLSVQLERRGVELCSLVESIDTSSPTGKFFFTVMAGLAQLERDVISQRTKAALAHKWTLKEKNGGDTPFGYTLDGERLIPHPEEQKAIRLVRDLHGKGWSLRQIAGELERRSIPTKAGKARWHPQQINVILKREAA